MKPKRTSRQEFEAAFARRWAKHCYRTDFTKTRGKYHDALTSSHWETWQAATRAARRTGRGRKHG